MQKLSSLFLVAPISAALWLGGCGLGKIAECNKLIQGANAQQQTLKSAESKMSGTPADMETVAVAFDKSSAEIAAIDLKDAKLKSFQKDYQDMLTRASKSCRDLSSAAKTKNVAMITKAQAEISSLGGNESKVVNEINSYCTGG
jgi:DNA repair ATPase RecN